MVPNCGVCGQFSGRVSEKSVQFRGLDRRGGSEIIETGVSDVFIGECCGLDVIEGAREERSQRPYQRYLNNTPNGGLRYVMLVEISIEPEAVELVSSFDPISLNTETEVIELDGRACLAITGDRLPETIRERVLGEVNQRAQI